MKRRETIKVRKLWIRTSERCAGIGRKEIEATMRDRSSRSLYNGLRSNWEREV
jgi:hypothetical protein